MVLVLVMLMSMFTGCSFDSGAVPDTVDNSQAVAQETLQKDMDLQTGLPNIKNWTEKKLLKKIYEKRDDAKLVCYAYTRNEMTGKYVYEGRCMGFGLPYATQYSNPEKLGIEDNSSEAGDVPYTLPQSEPNGLFMPTSADATWLLRVDEKTGDTYMDYVEYKLYVSERKKPAYLCESFSIPKDY